jgi:hypothetical protein
LLKIIKIPALGVITSGDTPECILMISGIFLKYDCLLHRFVSK